MTYIRKIKLGWVKFNMVVTHTNNTKMNIGIWNTGKQTTVIHLHSYINIFKLQHITVSHNAALQISILINIIFWDKLSQDWTLILILQNHIILFRKENTHIDLLNLHVDVLNKWRQDYIFARPSNLIKCLLINKYTRVKNFLLKKHPNNNQTPYEMQFNMLKFRRLSIKHTWHLEYINKSLNEGKIYPQLW